jgi:hypothetical protein
MSKPCLCCRGWSKKKHLCSHLYCEKPCRKQEQENLGVEKLPPQSTQQDQHKKQSLIQQQIQDVYLETMQKIKL